MARIELPGGVMAWSVTSYDVMKELLVDPRVSKDAYRHWPDWIDGKISPGWPLAIWVSVQNMVTAYGTDHARLRKPVAAAFTRRRVAALRPRIEALIGGLLDRLASLPPGQPVDLRAEFADLLPSEVVCELFGIPEGTRADLHAIIKGFFHTSCTPEEAEANGRRLYVTMAELLAAKRQSPGEDLTSALVAARDEDDGTVLSEKELIDTLILLFTAGYETTVNLIGNAVYALLTHPRQLFLVKSGGATWDDAVEESLRHEAPGANAVLRYAVEDIAIGPVTIPKGDPIVISFAAAGRDPHRHGPDADRYDLTRENRGDHMAFGFGTHHCLGRQLALLEGSLALEALFGRFPDLVLADPGRVPAPLESFISNGQRELPVLLHGPVTAASEPASVH
ncbi:cytochrome P450 [Streptomyces camponoticapitis]|uniref:Cytochrome P450 n=1 Tax=Streptomyces camponoticapitis TaxID=1616125 RepID=A0ABQ2ECB8_9ACTN|nr:cytochrome P450 [Streptomyces camponoticapitis]GGK06480.1 cytochrome P450 [Streptomyces camponoticapitis]